MLQYLCYFLCGFNPDKSFKASSMDGLSEGILLVQRIATSRTNLISSWNELIEPTSFSLHISRTRPSLCLFFKLLPALVSLPLVKTSKIISPKP